jgi:HEAT repeat protein
MGMRRDIGRRGIRIAVALVATLVLGVRGAGAATVFRLADDSTVVARGVVQGVQPYQKSSFLVFTIAPEEVVKGEAGKPLTLVQERVFGTEAPYFASGSPALVLAAPLPAYSYYKKSLPEGAAYLRWTDPKEVPADVAALADPAVFEAVRGYLAAEKDDRACARHLAGLLGSPQPRLRADALATIVERPRFATTLDVDALGSLPSTLADERLRLDERATILITLARSGAPGVAPVAAKVFAAHGPLQAPALDALVLVGRIPDEQQLLTASRSEDPALRAAAVRGLAHSTLRAAFERIGAIVTGDTVPEVRLAALTALGSAQDPRAVPILADAMRRQDKAEVQAAAQSLGRIGSPAAIEALGVVLREGSFDAEAAAAFGLMQTDRPAAYDILRAQRDQHPDPQVRRVIKICLGEHLEEHDD